MPDKVRTAARMPLQVLDKVGSGVRIATLPRPTSSVLWLSLFIDAGSRDGSPPQAATIAAWVAAANGSTTLEATVFPDVTEIALACARAALPRCLDDLARALATRNPSATAIERARVRLRDAQRRSLARDPQQAADLLAMQALLGENGRSFFALGTPSDEPVASAESVAKFLSDHYGATRALVVAAGDAEPTKVREAVARSFEHAPRPGVPRTARELRPGDEPRLSVSFDTQPSLSFAIAGRGEAQLNALLSSLSTALSRTEPRIEITGYVFDTRGGAIASVRGRCTDTEFALDRITRELTRLRTEPAETAPRRVLPDDLTGSSRRFGISFGAGGGAVLSTFEFSAALVLDAGPGAGPRGQETEADAQKNRSEHAKAVFERAASQGQPQLRGPIDEYGATVTTENGARVDVQFAQGADVAIAARVALGAENDPPLMHGQAALLSTLTSLACAGMGPELLRTQLQQLGATIEPRADPESYGLLLRIPKQHWQEGLDLSLRCLRAPARDAGDFAEAALQLQARLRGKAGALGYRARAAALIAPRAPGQVAAWGDPGQIGNITPREVETAARQLQNAVRWAVAIVGPVPVKEAAQRTARRLADMSSGALAKQVPATQTPAPAQAAGPRATNLAGITSVVTWSTPGKFEHGLGARLFARSVGALLSGVPGIEVLWQDGDVHGELAFAALALRIRPDVAPLLPQLLAAAARDVDDQFIDKAVPSAVAQARSTQTAADARLAVRADRAARARLGKALAEPNLEDTQKLMQILRDVQPKWAP